MAARILQALFTPLFKIHVCSMGVRLFLVNFPLQNTVVMVLYFCFVKASSNVSRHVDKASKALAMCFESLKFEVSMLAMFIGTM